MRTKWLRVVAVSLVALFAATVGSGGSARQASVSLVPLFLEAPGLADSPGGPEATGKACTTPAPVRVSTWVHCYRPQQITAAYGIDALHAAGTMGQGQTIVLLDSYGSPTAAHDLQFFHDTFYPSLPNPLFDQIYPNGTLTFNNTDHGNGNSGPAAAEGWAGEATLDIEWAYAIAPLAHIVLIAVPPAETLGEQGFPNLFKALQDAVDTYPAGTIFSQSFGVAEETFGGAATVQTASFDAVYKAAAAKGDTVLASSGDSGSSGAMKQARFSRTFDHPVASWPASSPWVTAVGGTQLQYGWTWAPSSDVPFTATGFNPAYFNYTTGGNKEAVWNETWLPAATGGGGSVIYPRPTWQPASVGNHRAIPDLSWNAAVNGGVLVYTSFFPATTRVGWHIYGGTSASSPQVAGLVALVNQLRAADGKAPVGHLAPKLYGIGNGAAFRDIVPVIEGTALSGRLVDNTLWMYNADGSVSPGAVPGLPTTAGWDMTTGFGSPHGAAFASALRALP